jgi:glycosyltransferase involved in cell wall biosynthesis
VHILIVALHRPVKPTGVCRHAVNLAQCLADSHAVSRVTVVIGAWQKAYFSTAFKLDSTKIQWVTIPIKNSSLSRNAWFMLGLPQLVRSLAPDIVHLSFPLPFLRQLFPCPIVTTIHDLYPYECPENFGSQVLFNRLFLKQSIKNSDGLACVSQSTLDKLTVYCPHQPPHQKTAVVYNYVDFSQIDPRPLSQHAIDFPYLLCVAQHRKNKNLDLLIRAYDRLLNTHQFAAETKLVLVGDSGPETENLLELIGTHGLQDRVLLLSSLDDRELCWLYQQCLAFVIPSSTEGFCLPLVEALYLSCRVVCSDIPIFREVAVSHSTFFSLQGDAVQHLAEAIVTALRQDNPSPPDPDARMHFSRLNATRQYLMLYQAIAPQLSQPCYLEQRL